MAARHVASSYSPEDDRLSHRFYTIAIFGESSCRAQVESPRAAYLPIFDREPFMDPLESQPEQTLELRLQQLAASAALFRFSGLFSSDFQACLEEFQLRGITPREILVPYGEQHPQRRLKASFKSFMIAMLAIVITTFSTGIDSKSFQNDEVEAGDDVPYNYGFFHFIFSMGAMYFGMLFIGWNLHQTMQRWSIDVGWVSTWVKIVNEWLAAGLYSKAFVYPSICLHK